MAGTAPPPQVRALAVAALLSALAIGCSNAPVPSSRVSPDRSVTPLVVPPVAAPLDESPFRDKPCELISADRARDLGFVKAKVDNSAGRPTCIWRSDRNDVNSLETLSIRFQSESGLATMADQCRDCDSWTVDMIGGYPVIRANGPLESKYGMCRLFVGIADDMAILVADGDIATPTEDTPDGPRCGRAEQATALALETMAEAG